LGYYLNVSMHLKSEKSPDGFVCFFAHFFQMHFKNSSNFYLKLYLFHSYLLFGAKSRELYFLPNVVLANWFEFENHLLYEWPKFYGTEWNLVATQWSENLKLKLYIIYFLAVPHFRYISKSIMANFFVKACLFTFYWKEK